MIAVGKPAHKATFSNFLSKNLKPAAGVLGNKHTSPRNLASNPIHRMNYHTCILRVHRTRSHFPAIQVLQFPRQIINRSRFYSSSTTRNIMPEYQAIVLGAGPAGIAVVGNLLNENVKPILWIDDEFQGGRLNAKYREVPRYLYPLQLITSLLLLNSTPVPIFESYTKIPRQQYSSMPFSRLRHGNTAIEEDCRYDTETQCFYCPRRNGRRVSLYDCRGGRFMPNAYRWS